MKKSILIAFAALVIVGCGGSPETVPAVDFSSMSHQERVEYHIAEKQHEEAFAYIQSNMIPEPLQTELLLATHSTFAWEMTHGEITDQRNRMPAALRHLRRVLELDPGNPQAIEQIALIEGIYRSMGREIPEGVAEDRVML